MHKIFDTLMGATFDQALLHLGLNLLLALLILLGGIWLAARLANFSQRAMQRAQVDVTLSGFLRKVIYGVLVAVLIVMALTTAGVSAAPLVAALGTAGLAIGLALQGSLSNLAWGVLLIIFRPFRVGDYVTAGGLEGTVESINLMHTLIVLPDNREAIVPNGKVGSDAILNFNRRGTRRFELQVGIGYKDDIGAAMAEIKRLFDADTRILIDPAPGIWTVELGDSRVELVVRGWVRSEDVWQTKADLLRAIKEHCDAAGISMPLPQRELTIVGGKLPVSASGSE